MERIGEVTAVRGDQLEVTICRPSDCEKCHACMGGAKQTTISLKGEARVGDSAVVELPERVVLKASAIAYVVPLVALLCGMFLGAALFPQARDMAGLAGALAALAISVLALALPEKHRRAQARWQPVLKQIIPKQEGADPHGN